MKNTHDVYIDPAGQSLFLPDDGWKKRFYRTKTVVFRRRYTAAVEDQNVRLNVTNNPSSLAVQRITIMLSHHIRNTYLRHGVALVSLVVERIARFDVVRFSTTTHESRITYNDIPARKRARCIV